MQRILSLDGGGIHGLLSAILLARIEAQRPGFLASADYYAGTSAGGITALALAAANDPAQKIEECIEFWKGLRLASNTPLGYAAGALGIAPIWSDKPWLKAIKRLFATNVRVTHADLPWKLTLKELQPKWVVIPTAKLSDTRTTTYWWNKNSGRTMPWRPKVFHNFPTLIDPDDFLAKAGPPGTSIPRGRDPVDYTTFFLYLIGAANASASTEELLENWIGIADQDELAVAVAMRTSSAPIAHRAFQGYVDGGLYANNPSMSAIEYALHNVASWSRTGFSSPNDFVASRAATSTSGGWRAGLDHLRVFSVGTGAYDYSVHTRDGRLGWHRWLADPREPMLLYLAMAAMNNDSVAEQSFSLLGPQQFHRLDPALPRHLNIFKSASVQDIAMLVEVAMSCSIGESLAWLDEFNWIQAVPPPPRA